MSKMISESSNFNDQKIVKSGGINNLPKVQRKKIVRKNDGIITTTRNKKIYISESSSKTVGIGSKNHFSNQRGPSPVLFNILTQSPNSKNQLIVNNQTNENLKNNINNKNNIIYNKNSHNNNDFYISKYQYKYNQNTNKNIYTTTLGYNSCSYDVKKTKKTIKYSYNSPERNQKILVKSILCSPISIGYTEIDNPLITNKYDEYKEEIEETEIITKTKMRKIWENEIKTVTECFFSYLGEKNDDKNYIIEEYEEKLKELNNTIYNLRMTKNTLKKEIEELNNNINNKDFFDMSIQSFQFELKNKNKNNNLSWNEITKKEKLDSINILGKGNNMKILIIQKLGKFTINGKEKPINIIDFGTNIEILPSIKIKKTKTNNLSPQYLDEIFLSGKQKFQNVKQRIKGFDILKKEKPKNIIQYLDEIEIIPTKNIKLKQKPKINNNIIESANSIFIPKQKKKLFTWDKFYGQELFIIAKKKKPINEIAFLDDLVILGTPKPENKIEFKDTIEIIPEPKAPYEIIFGDEFYIPEITKKLKSIPKPINKIEHRDKIKLLGKYKGKNIIQKVSLIEIYSLPKIIEYEEKDFLFIPGILKPENIIEEGDYIQILPEPIKPLKLLCESCDYINIFGFEKPKNEKQSLEGFDIFRIPKPINKIEQEEKFFIESTPKTFFLDIEFGDEIFIEKILKPENKAQRLKGFNILKKPKPLNTIQLRDTIEILPEPIQPLKLLCEKGDFFTIDHIKKPKNKVQKVGRFEIIKKFKKILIKSIKSNSFYILRQPKPLNKIQKTNDINLFGMIKNNDFVIDFGDVIILEGKERQMNKIQRINEIKILKKPKMKNIKQKTSEFQLLKKTKIKPKNKIQKRDNINLYSNIKTKNNKLDIEFGDEIFIEKILKPENKAQRLKGFDILKKQKPINIIQLSDAVEILPEPKQPLELICQKGDLFTIDHYIKKLKNKAQRVGEFEIIKNIKKDKNRCQKLDGFVIKSNKNLIKNNFFTFDNNNTENDNDNDNIIVNTANFQIISVSIRELYQQKLQGFVIYKKEKEPNEIEKNYNFIIKKDYDALLAKPIWDNLYIQREEINIFPEYNKIKNKNEIQNEYLIEENSEISRHKDIFFGESFSNSKELSDICKICGGKKRINENDSSRNEKKLISLKNQIIHSRNKKINSNNKNINDENENNKIYKTFLDSHQNEIDYINNIEITSETIQDKATYNSDDEFVKGKIIYNSNLKNYNNYKTYIVNTARRKKYYNYYNNPENDYEICNYSHVTEDINLKKNKNEIENKGTYDNKFRINNIVRQRNYNKKKYNKNQTGNSRYIFYRNYSESGDAFNKMCQHQSKSQLKTIVINKNRKRKLFRFEEGKGIKIIYNE